MIGQKGGDKMIHEKVILDGRYGAWVFITSLKDLITIDSHIHREIELCYSIEGAKEQKIGHGTYQSNPGTLLLVNSNETHSIETFSPTSSLVILIDRNLVLNRYPKFAQGWFDLEKCQETKFQIATIMAQLYSHGMKRGGIPVYEGPEPNEFSNGTAFGHLFIKSKIEEIIYLLLENHLVEARLNVANDISQKAIVMDVFDYIHNNYFKIFKLEDLAGELGYSQQYVSSVFSAYTGVKLFDFLNNYRMERCLAMMDNSLDDIDHIAKTNGFGTYRNFYNQFKKAYNITPSQYRKKIHIES